MDGARTAHVVAVLHQSACDACPGNSGPLLRSGFEKFADLLEPCAVSFACPVFREALPLELVFVGAARIGHPAAVLRLLTPFFGLITH